MKAVTLLYHDVIEDNNYASSGFNSGDADFYKLDKLEFIKHLDAIIAKHNLKAENLDTLYQLSNNHIPFYITFDDGGQSFLTLIANILEERGWVGIFFISTDYIGTSGFLTEAEVKELSDRGHIIGSHSCSHPKRISDCSYQELMTEWTESKLVLERITKKEVSTASVPGGFLSKQIEQAASEAGFRSLFTSEPQKKVYKTKGCLVLGRYSITQAVSTESAVKLASKKTSALQMWQYIYWNIKKFAKTYFGSLYAWFRLKVLR